MPKTNCCLVDDWNSVLHVGALTGVSVVSYMWEANSGMQVSIGILPCSTLYPTSYCTAYMVTGTVFIKKTVMKF
jgi:hypothetical protein